MFKEEKAQHSSGYEPTVSFSAFESHKVRPSVQANIRMSYLQPFPNHFRKHYKSSVFVTKEIKTSEETVFIYCIKSEPDADHVEANHLHGLTFSGPGKANLELCCVLRLTTGRFC